MDDTRPSGHDAIQNTNRGVVCRCDASHRIRGGLLNCGVLLSQVGEGPNEADRRTIARDKRTGRKVRYCAKKSRRMRKGSDHSACENVGSGTRSGMAERSERVMSKNLDLFIVLYSWVIAAVAWIAAAVHWFIGGVVVAMIVACPAEADARNPLFSELRESCDLLELNHFHDCYGKHVFDQLIFWRWDEPSSEYHVRAWTIDDTGDKHPSRNYHNDTWTIRYFDSTQRFDRSIVSKHFRESWTQRDPERWNKRILDECNRVSLVKRRSDITVQLSDIANEDAE